MNDDLAPSAGFAPLELPRFFAANSAVLLVEVARMREEPGGAKPEAGLAHSIAHRGGPLCEEGIVVPALGMEPGYYTVLVRSTATDAAMIPLTHVVYSTGFVLGTETGELTLWNGDRLREEVSGTHAHPASERSVRIAPGWYSVTVVAGIRDAEESDPAAGSNSEEWVCAFLLDPRAKKPAYTADLTHMLNFFAP